MNRKAFTPLFFLVSALCVMSLFLLTLFLNKDKATKALVYKDGELLCTLNLNENKSYLIEDKYKLKIEVLNRAVFISESSCPCKTCKSFGKLSRAGQSIVCLPSGVVISLNGNGDVDAVL